MVMNNIYRNAASVPESSFYFDEQALILAIKRIYEKDFNPMTEIDEGLFRSIWDTFNRATDEGFLAVAGDHDADFLTAIKHNNGVFSAFKTHRLQNDIAGQLLDDTGDIKPFERWLYDTEDIVDHQVRDWLETEYNTSVIRAHQAADWQQFEREKDILPNLKWNPTTSQNPGLDHMMFWNRIWSIDDPFWLEHRPGDRWNCKCSLSATDQPVTDNSDLTGDTDDPSPGLQGNPGKTAKIFSDDHPYYVNAYDGAQAAVSELMDRVEPKNA